jgi:hypothetical protein
MRENRTGTPGTSRRRSGRSGRSTALAGTLLIGVVVAVGVVSYAVLSAIPLPHAPTTTTTTTKSSCTPRGAPQCGSGAASTSDAHAVAGPAPIAS